MTQTDNSDISTDSSDDLDDFDDDNDPWVKTSSLYGDDGD
jgi:hypothetical protein